MNKPNIPSLGDIVSVSEFEGLARTCMSHMAYEYVSSGAADEHTLGWNCRRYSEIRLRPRVLVDVGGVTTETTLLGERIPFPILLAPTAYQRAVHPDGEAGTAKGAAAAGAIYCISTATNTSLEEIRAASDGPLWFQLYVQSDREFTKDVVQRAEAIGCRALVLTVDTPVLGTRDRMVRAKFRMPEGVTMPHLYDMSSHARGVITPERTTLTWEAVSWLRSVTKLPVLLKGILDADDAERGVGEGAAGVIVSNHGARNLDTAPATIDALPFVAERIAGRGAVLVDGGVRRGTDVLKALAFGACAVLIGRPHNYGLAVGGADGVRRVVELLVEELKMAMMLTGRATVASIDRTVIW
jgi:4-hydroxymandelate oxidase